jgi:hypothetical protein
LELGAGDRDSAYTYGLSHAQSVIRWRDWPTIHSAKIRPIVRDTVTVMIGEASGQVLCAAAGVVEMDMRSANGRQICLGHRHRDDFTKRFELIGWASARGKRRTANGS